MDNYNYAIIGNCTSAALVSQECSIDWLCLPFFNSPSLFAKILDEENGGYLKISAVKVKSITQKYLNHTAIVITRFECEDGIFDVRDYMPRFMIGDGKYYCPPEIHREIFPVVGAPKIAIELLPKPNYAEVDAEASISEDGEYVKIMSSKGDYNSYYLYSNLDLEQVITGEPIDLLYPAHLVLAYNEKIQPMTKDRVYIEYEKTKTYWLDWAYRTTHPERYKDYFIRSAITLKLLTFQRTGAVIAAPTTSLPEIIGKDRNWDYRYCWVRDGSMIVDLYARLGHFNSATRFMQFILNRMLHKSENIAVMYGVNGEITLTEKELPHLSGYRNSRPVRIGNDAYLQRQNDLYGELIETIYTYFMLCSKDHTINEDIWTVVRGLVREVSNVWYTKDSGIWEYRNKLQHYVHSKLMNWVAMDRAAKIAEYMGKDKYVDEWRTLAETIKKDICEHGWSETIGAFTMAYGSTDLDAANLLMLHYGFLPKDDPRIVSTVQKTYEALVRDNYTMRYSAEDDFGAPENAFLVCSFWMVNALHLIGEKEKAQDMFMTVLGCANQHGLFAEDVEIATKRLTGNFPQGYSHMALIQTILLLETDYNWSDAFQQKGEMRNMK